MLIGQRKTYVDDLLRGGNLGLALAPRLADRPAYDSAYQIALNGAGKAIVRRGMRMSGADKRFDRTISSMTGGQFSPAEIGTLEDRLLGAADWSDVRTLTGIAEGPPVDLSGSQKAVIDKLVHGLGSDPLGRRAQDAYQGAVSAGQVRVR